MDILDRIIDLFLKEHPWWIYVLSVIIPLCVLITIREIMCWFWKTNKMVRRLNKIERQLDQLIKTPPSPGKSTSPEPTTAAARDEEYTLD